MYENDFEKPKDDNPVVVFRLPREEEMKINKFETKKQGRPVYVDQVFCEIRIPADRNRLGVYPAHEVWRTIRGQAITYAMRYPKEYQAFIEKRAPSVTGTPLEELPFIPQTKRYELKALHVHTAEQLASLEGNNLKNLGMGGRELKEQAKAYLDRASGSADVTRYAAENIALREQMEALQAEMRSMRSAMTPAEDGEPASDDRAKELKDFIEQKTGSRPRGNPSLATLQAMVKEISETEVESAA